MRLKTFQIYYIKQFLLYLGLFVCLFMVLFVAIDFITNIRIYGETFLEAFATYALKLPTVFYQMQAIGLFAANIMVLSSIFTRREYVVMVTSGVSLFKVYRPILALTLVLSLSFCVVYDMVQPTFYRLQQARSVYNFKTQKFQFSYMASDLWYRFDNTIYRVGAIYPDKQAIDDIQVYEFDEQFRLRRWVQAKFAEVEGLQWQFQQGTMVNYAADEITAPHPFDEVTLTLQQTFDDFKKIRTDPDYLHFDQLLAGLHQNRFRDSEAHRYFIAMLERLIYVLFPLILLFVGTPLITVNKRHFSLWVNIGMTFLLSLAFWTANQIWVTMGHAGKVSPLLAVMTIPVLFLMVGGVLWVKKK